jgi:hypothetical protein
LEIGSSGLFAWVGLELRSSQSQPPKKVGLQVSHQHWLVFKNPLQNFFFLVFARFFVVVDNENVF